ncbi:YitT family protein [Desulfosporosinus sp. FKA]|uniref:YitT family protein n=1 Tax=Desulfosporosinus sp. FKA TaxID=1969834 RepID=UPI000B498AB6|nr:YitT family protein [Desulfosporosinus sp. FKA]
MVKINWSIFKTIGLILLGNTLYALAVTAFILPSGLITGGSTGLALFFYHQFNIPITLFVSLFNIAMFILGALVLGRAFALTTLISTFYYPLILGVFQNLPFLQSMTSDHLLSAIYAGLMIGLSLGLVIRAGASTGGMDIPPLVLNKKFGVSVSITLYAFDFTILLLQMLFANKEQVLYGILLVLIYTVVLDKVLLLGQSRMQVKIISKKYKEINQMIIHHLDRGSTIIQAETGYFHDKTPVLLTVVSNRELPLLNKLALSIDPNAFMIINQVNKVNGRGFSMDKSYM